MCNTYALHLPKYTLFLNKVFLPTVWHWRTQICCRNRWTSKENSEIIYSKMQKIHATIYIDEGCDF